MRIIQKKVTKHRNPPSRIRTKCGNNPIPTNNDVFRVFIQDGSLTVEIPGKVVLALNDPNEEGLWYSKLSNRLYFIFKKDDSGEITEMELHELIPLPKKSAPEEIDENIPEEFRPYLGNYYITALQAEFTVRYKDGSLLMKREGGGMNSIKIRFSSTGMKKEM